MEDQAETFEKNPQTETPSTESPENKGLEKVFLWVKTNKVLTAVIALILLGVLLTTAFIFINSRQKESQISEKKVSQRIKEQLEAGEESRTPAPTKEVRLETIPSEETEVKIIEEKDKETSLGPKLENRVVDEKSVRPQLTSDKVAIGYVERSLLQKPISQRFPFDFIPKVFAQSLPRTVVLFYIDPEDKIIWAYDVLLEQKFKIYESEHKIQSLLFNSKRKSIIFISYIYTREICRLMLNEYSLRTRVLSLIDENDICKSQKFSLSSDESRMAFVTAKIPPGSTDRMGTYHCLMVNDLESGESKEASSSASYDDFAFWSHDDKVVFFGRRIQKLEGSISESTQVFKYILQTDEERRVTNSEDRFDFRLPQISKDQTKVFAFVGDIIDFTENFDEYKKGKSYIQFAVYDIEKDSLTLYPDTFGAKEIRFLLDEDDKNVFLIIKEDNPSPDKLAHLNLSEGSLEIIYTTHNWLRVLGWNGTNHNILLLEFVGAENKARLLDYDTTTKDLQLISELEDIEMF